MNRPRPLLSPRFALQDEKNLASMANIVGVDVGLQKKASDIAANVQKLLRASGEIKTAQLAGVTEMNNGVAANRKSCQDSVGECAEFGGAGVKQFRRGLKTLESADDRYYRFSRSLSFSPARRRSSPPRLRLPRCPLPLFFEFSSSPQL